MTRCLRSICQLVRKSEPYRIMISFYNFPIPNPSISVCHERCTNCCQFFYIDNITMMKYLLLALLACSVLSAYNATKAKSMAYICASTFGTEAEINSWTCKYCSYNKLTNTKAFNNSILDIFGFTGYSPSEDAIIVAFRSTVSLQNWIVNLDATQVPYPGCSGCQVHQGFYNAFSGVEGYIRAQIQKLTALFRNAKIYVTGYSLGSALATIAALDIHNLFGHVDQLYTFGEPRVGNENFASYVTSSLPERYRVIHYADIVPHVPPQIPIPYAHFAYEIWYDEAMKSFKQCGAEEFKCSKSLFPTSWTTSDHDINFYISIP